jgi:DNA-binding transcriptional LysR family regulator
MRLDKFICKSTELSRSEAKNLLKRGEVKVNGMVAKNAAMQVQEDNDISIDGQELTVRHLRYFIATAETGKIQLAAEKVHMSPSAVADAIKNLESILGIDLFDRHRYGVILTYDGHRFLNSAQRILNMVDDSIFAFQNQKKNTEGRFILGASVSVVGYFLPIPLGQFEKIYPKVKVNIVENSRDALEEKLRAREIDIAFMITSNIKTAEGLEVETLFRSTRTLWCAESHRFAKMDKVPLAEIAKESYIMLASDEAESNTNQFWKISKLSTVIPK